MNNTTDVKTTYKTWLEKATADPTLVPELGSMSEEEITDAFWRDLEFGTAGLRGTMGAGTNRMNVYTVSAAARGLAEYIRSAGGKTPSAAISYDTRNNSEMFAKAAAATLAASGVKVFIFPKPMPVPCLSYAIRKLGTDTGIMITASHNPKQYNGFKAYGPDGCQLTEEGSKTVSSCIRKLDIFDVTKHKSFDEYLAGGMIEYTPASLYDEYRTDIRKLSCLAPGDEADRDVKIVYSPLNGTGLDPVMRTLHESGYSNVTVVEEQRKPDGDFPTCPYPNPEKRDALALGLRYAERLGADLMLATDPDCDRVGVAIRKPDEEYAVLTGNQIGMLLLDYVCSQRAKQNRLPADAMFVKSIVTSDLCVKIAAAYGVRCQDVLTGFKYIGEQLTVLEKSNREEAFLLGFEESCGYLSGSHVREKDGTNAAFLICEMFSYYKAHGENLWHRLQSIYERFGYIENVTLSYSFPGETGFEKMRGIMTKLRAGLDRLGDIRVVSVTDYLGGVGGLPVADVLKFTLDGEATVIIRPSGTEPQLKAYFGVPAPTKAEAEGILDVLKAAIGAIMV